MYTVSLLMISYSQKEVQVQASSKYTYMMRFHLQTKNNRFSLVSLYIERVSLARSKGA